MESWFFLSIVTALFWGAAGVVSKLSTPKLGVARVALILAVVEGVLYAIAFLYWREDVPISLADAVLAAASCIVGVIGYLCFFESIMEGQVSIAGTIAAAYPALAVVGALIVLSESMTPAQALGVVAIIGGVVALSYEPNPGSAHAMSKRTLTFALLAFALWGFWSLTSKMAIDEIGAGNIFGFYILSSVTAPVFYYWYARARPLTNQGMAKPPVSAWMIGALGLGINVVGAFAFSFALEGGSAALVVPITSAYPIVTILLAVGFLREKMDKMHAVAAGIVVLGLVMIGLTV